MSFAQDMLEDLDRLAHGETTRTPAQIIALWALPRVEASCHVHPHHDDSVEWLEALYRLEDPRV
jgi:hypothetical protein